MFIPGYSQGSNTSLPDGVGDTLDGGLDSHHEHSELARRVWVFLLLPQYVSCQSHAVRVNLLTPRIRHLAGSIGSWKKGKKENNK